MKKYVLIISEFFPKNHKKSGQETNFGLSIKYYEKIHTIRQNYDLWEKRFRQIEQGKAVLSVRVWQGKPYKSEQLEIFQFNKSHGIGIEQVLFDDYFYSCLINEKRFALSSTPLVENDGLSHEDFEDWFKKADLSKPMAILHLTPFRYNHQ